MSLTSYDLTDGKEPISHAEIDYLKELVRSLPPEPVILQIGADKGVFTVAALEERPDIRMIYSVDIEDCPQELENVEKAGLDKYKVHQVKGNSHELGFSCPLTFHMAFIDGDHWNPLADIKAWVETGRAKSGGIVAFHDFIVPPNPPNNPGDVYNQVRAWADANPQFEQLGWVDRVIAYRVP